jgi:hypothetical protein
MSVGDIWMDARELPAHDSDPAGLGSSSNGRATLILFASPKMVIPQLALRPKTSCDAHFIRLAQKELPAPGRR